MKHAREDDTSDSSAGTGVGGAPHRTVKNVADMLNRYTDQLEQSHETLRKNKPYETEEDIIIKEARRADKISSSKQGQIIDNRRVASNIAITATLTREFSDAVPKEKLAEMERHDTYMKLKIAWSAYSRIPMDKRDPVVPAVLLADWSNLGRFGPYSRHVLKEDGAEASSTSSSPKNFDTNVSSNNNNNNNEKKRTFMFVEVVNTRVTESEGCFAVLAFRFTPQNICATKPKYVTRELEFYREAWFINCYVVYSHMPITIEDDKSNFQ
jgi:hypothetical protein